VGKFAEDDEY